ncbi:MAG: 4Fe-4S dicluster domain-containing protein [Planctomycetota bacterium]|jgi:Fe-S-cluster-containing hydrogenase component 2
MSKVITADSTKCIGCKTCEVACSLRFTSASHPAASRLGVVRLEERGLHLPVVCRHCTSPPCAAACPVDALVRHGRTGAVVLDLIRCIGCRMCIRACPFGAMVQEPAGGDVVKCDLCGGGPQCVSACPAGALAFEDPAAPAARRRRKHARDLAEEGSGDEAS